MAGGCPGSAEAGKEAEGSMVMRDTINSSTPNTEDGNFDAQKEEAASVFAGVLRKEAGPRDKEGVGLTSGLKENSNKETNEGISDREGRLSVGPEKCKTKQTKLAQSRKESQGNKMEDVISSESVAQVVKITKSKQGRENRIGDKMKNKRQESCIFGRGRVSFHYFKQMARNNHQGKGSQRRVSKSGESGKSVRSNSGGGGGDNSNQVTISNELSNLDTVEDLEEFGSKIGVRWTTGAENGEEQDGIIR